MKTILAFTMILTTLFLSESVAQDGKMKSDENKMTKQVAMSIHEAQNIITDYLNLKDALVSTNGELASTAAGKMLTTIGRNKSDLLDKIRFDVEHIAGTKDVSHQRDHFSSLSDNLYLFAKEIGPINSPLYYQYCPMATQGEGAYWLSANKEIKNPYFGDKMLRCGSTKETIYENNDHE
ncbi:MAG TPA: DUF3347 domain-containing protein [Bacteroidia bacterium]|nr:DUF3347 domain-containing protein [Bacteroidia bacterium]